MLSHNVEQRSEEWHKLRLGRLTASRVADATARTKSGWGASRANYMAELVCERLTGVQAERYVSKEMTWGTEQEPNARAAYEWVFDVEVQEVGFIQHPTLDAGGSPDGLVGDDGMIELKCPGSAQHIETLLTKAIDGRYIKQMQWLMGCSGRAWCDFSTFDPRMPEPLQLWTFRVMRDDKMIAELEHEAVIFLRELDEKVAALRKLGGIEIAA